ncbi:hypothetical protein FW774_04525 (plasmid) [Pedobacter sp. BS3]|uniref:hypothetical protein n=1 Tax=Pedobacter sp. BS3 TaxID=2567937 RepID=UPI0011F09918|nr:hypothetical protein [Pedobacter sp. BS3]TZF86318.1 hypothetical protein FW774_04525 [Pedobacter sp. BS3]
MKTNNNFYLILLLSAFFSCKKHQDDNNVGNTASPLVRSTNWETLGSVKFSITGGINGCGMQAEDMVINGNNIGVLYGEVYDPFKGLASSGARSYKAIINIGNKDAVTVNQVFKDVYIGKTYTATDYRVNMIFFNNTFNARLFGTYNASTQTQPNRISYEEKDERDTVTVPQYSMYDGCFQRQNIVHNEDGSVLFTDAGPDYLYGAMYLNYYDAPTKTWLAKTAPYENGFNSISPSLPNRPPAITSSWGFMTGSGKYRAMIADYNGGITIVRPNMTNHNCDTLANIQNALPVGSPKNQLVGGTVSGNIFYGLVYNSDSKKLYEFKWTEGDNTITKVFGDIALDGLPNAMLYSKEKYFEMKPDGTPFYLMKGSIQQASDFTLNTVSASGIKEIGRIKVGEFVAPTQLSLPRYSNGYYYVVAYIPYLAGLDVFPQLDVIRIKE